MAKVIKLVAEVAVPSDRGGVVNQQFVDGVAKNVEDFLEEQFFGWIEPSEYDALTVKVTAGILRLLSVSDCQFGGREPTREELLAEIDLLRRRLARDATG